MSNSPPISSLFSSVYIPEYSKSDENLVRGHDGPRTLQEIEEELDQEQYATTASILTDAFKIPGTYHKPRPLSIEEGKAYLNDKENLLNEVLRVRDRVASLEEKIDSRLGKDSGSSFTFHFKKRPNLRKALKVITGKAKNFVTYEDYKKALALKAKLEQEDASAFYEKAEG